MTKLKDRIFTIKLPNKLWWERNKTKKYIRDYLKKKNITGHKYEIKVFSLPDTRHKKLVIHLIIHCIVKNKNYEQQMHYYYYQEK